MTEAEQKTTAPRSYRVDDDVAKKISDLTKELGMNQNGVFEALLAAYELQQSADLIPEAKMDIDNFISHLTAIQAGYRNILSINAQTEDRVRQEFQRRLDNNDKQIADLLENKEKQKARIEELQESYEKAEGDLVLRESELAETKQRVLEKEKSLDDKQTIIDSLTARLPEQAEIDAKIQSLEQEIQVLRSSIAASEEAKIKADAATDSARAELEMAKMQAAAAEKAHQQEIDALTKQAAAVEKTHQQEIGTLTKQAAADLKAAVSDARQEERDKAQAKFDKLQEKIDELRAKVDEQRDIITELNTAK